MKTTSYDQARLTAQANADRTGVPWIVFRDTAGALRVERDTPTRRHTAEVFQPRPQA